MTALTVMDSFLAKLFGGELEEALGDIQEDARFISVNPNPNPNNPTHGTFVGPEGARAFFGAFGEHMEAGSFDIDVKFGNDTHVAMYGRLAHKSRATGKPFVSHWSLIGEVKDDKIQLYHFFEDTEALAEALRP